MCVEPGQTKRITICLFCDVGSFNDILLSLPCVYRSGNPFYRVESDPVPPPLVLKAGPGISMRATGKKSAAAKAAGQLDSREFAYKADSSSYILDVNCCEVRRVKSGPSS